MPVILFKLSVCFAGLLGGREGRGKKKERRQKEKDSGKKKNP